MSPRNQAFSQGGFKRVDSEVIATSENPRLAPNNRRFHKSQRGNVSSTSHHFGFCLAVGYYIFTVTPILFNSPKFDR